MEFTQNHVDQNISESIADVNIEIDRGSTEVIGTSVTCESNLWKRGKSFLHLLSKRYYLLSGSCLYYYYAYQAGARPKGVIFLTGSIIERIREDEMEMKGYYGFEISQGFLVSDHHRHEKRVLYCKGEEEREKWISSLQHAAHNVSIEEDYVIGKELESGRCYVVCECIHKITCLRCVVKIIDKSTIRPEEEESLRTEIAILKLSLRWGGYVAWQGSKTGYKKNHHFGPFVNKGNNLFAFS